MAYATVEQVRLALSPDGSSDPTLGTAASLEDAQLEDAIGEAASEVDGKLAGRYTVPFDPVPGLVTGWTRDIAAFLATLTYRRGTPLSPDDPVRLRYLRAKDMLDQASKGLVDLVGVADGTATSAAEPTVVNPYDGVLFPLDSFHLNPSSSYRRWPLG